MMSTSDPINQVVDVKISDIVLRDSKERPFDLEKIEQLEASILDQGLRQPIHLYLLKAPHAGKYGVAAGRHRLQALIKLDEETVPAFIISRKKAKAWKWSENLHRKRLTALELSEHIV